MDYLLFVWVIWHPFFLPLISISGFSFGSTISPHSSFSVCAFLKLIPLLLRRIRHAVWTWKINTFQHLGHSNWLKPFQRVHSELSICLCLNKLGNIGTKQDVKFREAKATLPLPQKRNIKKVIKTRDRETKPRGNELISYINHITASFFSGLFRYVNTFSFIRSQFGLFSVIGNWPWPNWYKKHHLLYG